MDQTDERSKHREVSLGEKEQKKNLSHSKN